MLRDQTLTLPDGRRLGYNQYGESKGTPIFYFHGWPSCRLEGDLFDFDALGLKLNLHIIAPDRPGMGLSTFQPSRTLADWPRDVLTLANRLGIDKFAVLGYSGGSVYSAVTALKLADHISAAGIISCAGPYIETLTVGLAPTALQLVDASLNKPFVARLIFRMMGIMARFTPDRFMANAMSTLPQPDQTFLGNPAHQRGFVNMVKEAMRQGPRGAQLDTALISGSWDFGLDAIRTPMHLWHGDVDRNATLAMARYTATAITGSDLTIYEGEGHISALSQHAEEILKGLIGVTA